MTLTGLTPATHYQYRVGDGTNWSEWQHFTTESATADPFDFIYLGDVQNGIKSQGSRVIRNAFRDAPDARIVLQAGDLIDDAENDEQWGEVFDATSYEFGTKHFLMAPGNHEYDGVELSEQFSAQFAYPDNGPSGTGAARGAPRRHRLLHRLPGRALHLAQQQHHRRRGRSPSRPRGSRSRSRQPQPVDGRLLPPPGLLPRRGAQQPGHPRGLAAALREVRRRPRAAGPRPRLRPRQHRRRGGGPAVELEQGPVTTTGPSTRCRTSARRCTTPGPRVWNENGAHLRRMGGALQLYQLIDVEQGKLRYESRTADGQYYDGLTIVKNEHGKAVTDDKAPDEIDEGNPGPCLGCENPDRIRPTRPIPRTRPRPSSTPTRRTCCPSTT